MTRILALLAVGCGLAAAAGEAPTPALQGAAAAADYAAAGDDSAVCSGEAFPFVFRDASGNEVPGVVGDDGACTFPSAACGGGSTRPCCETRPGTVRLGNNYTWIGLVLLFIPHFFLDRYFRQIGEKDPTLLAHVEQDVTPGWITNSFLRHLKWLWDFGIWIGSTTMVVVPQIMKPSVQSHMLVSSRNVLQAADAFLVPYKEIFQFVEDIANVKINYALSSGNKEAANRLVHLGLAASIFTSLLASVLASVLGAIPPVLRGLTTPGLVNDMELYQGCDIVEAGADSKSLIRPYWFIEVWRFPGMQMMMVLMGFMYGAMEYNTMGWILSIGGWIVPLIWFTNLSKPIERLLLLALGDFAQPYCILLMIIAYMKSPLGSTIRDNTGVYLSFKSLRESLGSLFSVRSTEAGPAEEGGEAEGAAEGEPGQDSESDSSIKELMREGLCLMSVDVGVQLAKSLAVYLALATDAATGYQLAALDSNLPTYGIGWAMGLGFTFKILGPMLLSIKEYGYFFKLARLYLAMTFLLIPLIVGMTEPYISGLALSSGENACQYAGSSECVPFFTKVFGLNASGDGRYTLYSTYRAFSYGCVVESLFFVTKAMMITMLEFKYMLKCTGVAMLFYAAAIIVASLARPFAKQAIAYWIAQYVPQAVLVLLFIGRLYTLFRRMVKGEVKGAMRNRFRAKMSMSQDDAAGTSAEALISA